MNAGGICLRGTAACAKTAQNEDSHPTPFTPLDEEVAPLPGSAQSCAAPAWMRLAAAKDVALQAFRKSPRRHRLGASRRAEEERLSTHLFEYPARHYRGWLWFATACACSREATICEVGLLPGDDALIAPDWVLADRVRPEDLRRTPRRRIAESAETAEAEGLLSPQRTKRKRTDPAVEETAEAESRRVSLPSTSLNMGGLAKAYI